MRSVKFQNKKLNRTEFRSRCRQIHSQIDCDLDKIDQLLKIINDQKRIFTIIPEIKEQFKQIVKPQQVNNNNNNNNNSDKNRKQLRLKYKYSTQRDYKFTNCQQLHQQQDDQQQQQQYLLDSQQQQQNLLDSQQSQQQKHELSKSFKDNFTSIYQPQKITIETRYNWIEKYLNMDLNDTIIRGVDKVNRQIEIKRFDQMNNTFQIQIYEQDNKNKQGLVDSTNIEKGQKVKIKKVNTNSRQKQRQRQNCSLIKYSQLMSKNRTLDIYYPKHTSLINIIQPNSLNKQVVRLNLSNKIDKIRIIAKLTNLNEDKMQRIMIFKEINNNENIQQQNNNKINDNQQVQNKDEQIQKYKIIWTRYEKQSFTEDLLLQGGSSYLITNLCSNPNSTLSLIFNPSDLPYISIQKTQYDPWRSYNLLCASFQQCCKVFMGQNNFDNTKPLQFYRANFLDYGIILQIYQNIYHEKISFLEDQNQQKIQDKQLLFTEIYTKYHNYNVYLPEELVIKFYQVTEKPARLYFPDKKVLIGEKIAEHTTVYSTFK